jgi:SAM-dependent methyltransferase
MAELTRKDISITQGQKSIGRRQSSAICLVCGSSITRNYLMLNGYQVFRCAACGFEFVHPTPTPAELARYYDQSYAVPLERYARSSARNTGHIADLERWQPGRGRLLEVGASYGHSLAAARARGWLPAGVELSPTASRYARKQLGLPVFTADLLDAPFAERSFDAAIMWHVLEHTHDPSAQVARLFSLLRPGGVLGLRVPNIAGFGARVAGRSWNWMCPPAHLWYFSPQTLPRLLAQHGFDILEVATLRGDGDNPYQHMLVALGGQLNALRRRVAHAPKRSFSSVQPNMPSDHATTADAAPVQPNPAALQRAWLRLLARAQPITGALDRATRPLIAPLEAAGWGDELLCYARRP